MSASRKNIRTGEFLLYPDRCTTCMSCVLACSFHHAGTFDRDIASVEVLSLNKERQIQLMIHLETQADRRAVSYTHLRAHET